MRPSPFRLALITATMLALLAGGIAACGKRGDPYRPSEIPERNSYANPHDNKSMP